ncbi:MAG: AMP-binding protein, partial [Bacteroidales bacterium]
MGHTDKQTVRDLIWASFVQSAERPALGFVGDKLMTYGELRQRVENLGFHLTRLGYSKGDRVAILGPNSPEWAVVYLSLLSLGVVAVPILPDFHASEVSHIFGHAGIRGLFASPKQLARLDQETIDSIPDIFSLDDFSILNDKAQPTLPESWRSYEPEGALDPFTIPLDSDDLATLIYTSGTTGFSKGVMLDNGNLVANVFQCAGIQPLENGEVFLSILPLSHTYENTVGFLLPITFGAAIHYLDKAPTAAVLIPALKLVRPTYMLSVPLVIEKIYKAQILGKVQGSALLKILYKLPAFRKFFHRLAGKRLYATFGGRLKFFGIGGAKLDPGADRFLREARFPYAIGYGLTETAPLLAGANPSKVRHQSTGVPVQGVEIRINEPDEHTGIGEIWARGRNVMKGYYREPEITAQVLTSDGWFRTGDLGIFDRDGNLYIKGRLKNVIIGASGENIYPEEIESVINRFKFVMESVVVQQKGRLVALVHFNMEELEKQFQHLKDDARQQIEKKIEELKSELQHFVNTKVNKYSRIQAVVPYQEPFEKTPTNRLLVEKGALQVTTTAEEPTYKVRFAPKSKTQLADQVWN